MHVMFIVIPWFGVVMIQVEGLHHMTTEVLIMALFQQTTVDISIT